MRILVLSTWFPYPTYQGSKNRAYHLIKALAKCHQLALVSYEDVPIQPEWVEHMRQYCRQITLVPRQPFHHDRAGKLRGWFSLSPSAVVAGYSKEMSAAVAKAAAEFSPDAVFAITFVTAPYALEIHGIPRIFDVDNLLTFMLKEAYQQAASPVDKARRGLAYWKFRRYESSLMQKFDLNLVVSDHDRFRAVRELGADPAAVGVVANGVDLDHNHPADGRKTPNQMIFTGALTYHPNYDAMDFFLSQIYPHIRLQIPHASLLVTGSTRGVPLAHLPDLPGVTFTGFLDDVRPAITSSAASVVPLRQGAGTRLKILEAMANGVPVVSTSKGAEGLDLVEGEHLLIADHPQDFADQTIRLLQDERLQSKLAANALAFVRTHCDWAVIGDRFNQLVSGLDDRSRRA